MDAKAEGWKHPKGLDSVSMAPTLLDCLCSAPRRPAMAMTFGVRVEYSSMKVIPFSLP
jgi:hypothetical protein